MGTSKTLQTVSDAAKQMPRRARVEIERILVEHARSNSLGELAEKVGMPKSSVSARLVVIRKKLGIKLRPFTKGAVHKYTPEYVAQLQELYNQASKEVSGTN